MVKSHKCVNQAYFRIVLVLSAPCFGNMKRFYDSTFEVVRGLSRQTFQKIPSSMKGAYHLPLKIQVNYSTGMKLFNTLVKKNNKKTKYKQEN